LSTTPETIPYERQSDPQGNRMCGAASLAMVYRSFGKTVPQEEIWRQISKRNSLGSLSSATYRMCRDAVQRGFAALAIQARFPLQALRLCRENGIRVILSHRLREDLPTGHYTTFLEIDAESTVLHDPYYGPSRRLSNAQLLELWRPGYPDSEITGNVLIGISRQPSPAPSPACPLCGTAIPASVPCAACDRPIVLQPAALLGCIATSCAGRMWNYLCCPECDYTWSFAADGMREPPPAEASSEQDPWNLAALFGELDKFCAHIRALPAAAGRADIAQQLSFIEAGKEKLKLAQSEQVVRRREQEVRLSTMEKTYGQQEAAVLKRKEEINKPGEALDGNSLARALLKNLGLTN
jgi:hypothetical protein